jgi:hypothetical protein
VGGHPWGQLCFVVIDEDHAVDLAEQWAVRDDLSLLRQLDSPEPVIDGYRRGHERSLSYGGHPTDDEKA